MSNRDTRSGEIISAGISIAIAISAMVGPTDIAVFHTLSRIAAMPEWAFIAAMCGIFCMFAAFAKSCRVQAAARMMSGCVWGSMLMVLGMGEKFFPLFWIALVLFLFDVYAVTIKGQSWTQRSNC